MTTLPISTEPAFAGPQPTALPGQNVAPAVPTTRPAPGAPARRVHSARGPQGSFVHVEGELHQGERRTPRSSRKVRACFLFLPPTETAQIADQPAAEQDAAAPRQQTLDRVLEYIDLHGNPTCQMVIKGIGKVPTALSREEVYAACDHLYAQGRVVILGRRKHMLVAVQNVERIKRTFELQIIALIEQGLRSPSQIHKHVDVCVSTLSGILEELVTKGELSVEGGNGRHKMRVYTSHRAVPKKPYVPEVARSVLAHARYLHRRQKPFTTSEMRNRFGPDTDRALEVLCARGSVVIHAQGEHHASYRYEPGQEASAPRPQGVHRRALRHTPSRRRVYTERHVSLRTVRGQRVPTQVPVQPAQTPVQPVQAPVQQPVQTPVERPVRVTAATAVLSAWNGRPRLVSLSSSTRRPETVPATLRSGTARRSAPVLHVAWDARAPWSSTLRHAHRHASRTGRTNLTGLNLSAVTLPTPGRLRRRRPTNLRSAQVTALRLSPALAAYAMGLLRVLRPAALQRRTPRTMRPRPNAPHTLNRPRVRPTPTAEGA